MPEFRVSVVVEGSGEVVRVFRAAAEFAEAPFLRSPELEDVAREGVEEQLARGGDPPWKKARPLGSSPPAAITLGGPSGTIGREWARAEWEVEPGRAALSAGGLAAVHHEGWTIRARRRIADGRLAMQALLAAKGAPWPPGTGPPREDTLLAGLVLPSRPMRITREMQVGAALAVSDAYDRALREAT